MNNRDWRQEGATEDTVFLVNGKEYKIDDNGHLNIPEGEPVIYGETVVFPKELGEFMRQKSNGSGSGLSSGPSASGANSATQPEGKIDIKV